jgi:hypothetical protein
VVSLTCRKALHIGASVLACGYVHTVIVQLSFTGEQPRVDLIFSSDTNFFVGMIGYVRARLANYSRYCMVCHKKHTCARYSHPPA